MGKVSVTEASITYVLGRTRRFAITSAFIGVFVGGSVALAYGGSLATHLVTLTLVTIAVTGGLCWLLCRLAAWVTAGTGRYEIPNPTWNSPRSAATGSGLEGQRTREDPTLVDDR